MVTFKSWREMDKLSSWLQEKNWRLRREQSTEDALGRKKLWEASGEVAEAKRNVELQLNDTSAENYDIVPP